MAEAAPARERKKPTRKMAVVRFSAPLKSVRPFWRPACRGECPAARPCPFIGCRHNLYLDIQVDGRVAMTHPTLMPWEVPEKASCSLDAAAAGPMKLEAVGRMLNLTRERVRQIEKRALARLAVFDSPELRGMLRDDVRYVLHVDLPE